MLHRRHFVQALLAGAMFPNTSFAMNSGLSSMSGTDPYMPDESAPHARTWMAFGASERIWGRRLLPRVRKDLALIANTLARYEAVSMLVRPDEMRIARSLLDEAVETIACPIDDLWMRDTGPVFLLNDRGEKMALDMNFNGWGGKQAHGRDAKVARFIAAKAGVKALGTSLVLEGGCIEVDGEGTAIITESCVLNANRNPGVSKAQFEDELMPLLGLDKIIWLPGIRGMDITDGHTDFYARFAHPGVVLAGYDPDPESFDHEVTLEHLEILRAQTDAAGKKLDVHMLEGPMDLRWRGDLDDFAAGYIGFYVCNGAVIMQNFGDRYADAQAKRTLQKLFPDRVVEALNLDGIAAGGGSIHCATQQEPQA